MPKGFTSYRRWLIHVPHWHFPPSDLDIVTLVVGAVGLVSPMEAQAVSPGINGVIAWSDGYEVFVNGTNVTNTANAQELHPEWSPEGTRIAYERYTALHGNEIWLMDANGQNKTFLSGGQHPAWSPDGTKVGYRSGTGIAWMAVDGSSNDGFSVPGNSAAMPDWSPDGSKIVYEGLTDIWVVNADGTGATSLAPGTRPSWSPDGDKIVFERGASPPRASG